MKVTVFKHRKPTDTVVELAAINDTSVATLVGSLGEKLAKDFIEAGIRQRFAAATKKGPIDPKTWKPTPDGRKRARKTPEQRIRDFAAKMGVAPEALGAMLAAKKAA